MSCLAHDVEKDRKAKALIKLLEDYLRPAGFVKWKFIPADDPKDIQGVTPPEKEAIWELDKGQSD